MGKTLSGAEREQKAGERLAENRAQLAAIQGRMATSQSALDSLQKMEHSAAAQVTAAEQAVEQAAQRVIDAHAAALVAVETDEATSAQETHGAAVDARKAARATLDEARAALEATRAKVAAESAPIKRQIADDDDARQDLSRLISSLERAQTKAHHDAGVERLAAARERHQALQARLVEQKQAAADIQADMDAHHVELAAILAEHPTLANSREHAEASDPHRALKEILSAYAGYLQALVRWHYHPDRASMEFNPYVLAQRLTNHYLSDFNAIHSMLMQSPQASVGFAMGPLRDIREELAGLDAQRVRRIDKLPSVAAE